MLPATCEETLILKKERPVLPLSDKVVINDLEAYIRQYENYNPELEKIKRKLEEHSRWPIEPCYITSHLYDKTGNLVHVVGKGKEFSGLDEDGRPMLLYDKDGLPKNSDGSVRRFTLAEILEIQKKQTENLPSNLPRRPKLSKRKMAKKRKNPLPKKLFDNFDGLVAAEAERTRRMNERM